MDVGEDEIVDLSHIQENLALVHCPKWMNVNYLFVPHVHKGGIHLGEDIEIIPLHT